MTGSKPWQDGGKQDTAADIEEMKAANGQNSTDPAPSSIGGKIDKAAGQAVGCEGMESEGEERLSKAS